MAVYVLYVSKPSPPSTTANIGAYTAPTATGMSIDDANVLTDNPGILGNPGSTASTKALFLQRWLSIYQNHMDRGVHGARFLLSADAGATFLAADQ